ncbi:MAG: 2-oxoglutarate dehydrogenase complex dihydrolipoyllysine-residue succinyltransferase [Chloroflexota bacterium]
MSTDVVVPELGESVVEATIATWMVKQGDSVNAGDVLVELETDKVNLEVEAPVSGVVQALQAAEGDDVNIGDIIAIIDAGSNGVAPTAAPTSAPAQPAAAAPLPAPAPVVSAPAPAPAPTSGVDATPVARRMAEAEGVNLSSVSGSGAGGKITKQDVASALQSPAATPAPTPAAPAPAPAAAPATSFKLFEDDRREERIKMSRRRRTIAKRLVEAQQTAAMLTTFNEIDMHAVMELRKKRKVEFEERTGARLGFMSFFVKATVAALKKFPRLNAEIEGDEMIIKHFYDIGIAVGSEEGLVVPVVRDCDRKSFAELESAIRGYGQKVRDGNLGIDDLVGGTFTITNGGVFGSMLSTPILNTPQVGILGMHNIVERPTVVDGEITIRPIMMVALSYDHRIVDGSEAVRFLYTIKELIEDPERLLLEG